MPVLERAGLIHLQARDSECSGCEAVQEVPLKLLPGVPVKPVLSGDSPFLTGQEACGADGAAALEPGGPLPAFAVRAHDAFGNLAIPSSSLSWAIEVASPGISPNPAVAAPDMQGIATLLNGTVARGVQKDSDWTCAAAIQVAACAPPAAVGMEAALQAAAAQPLEGLKLLLAPSTAPASLSLTFQDVELPFDDTVEGAEGKRVFNVRP